VKKVFAFNVIAKFIWQIQNTSNVILKKRETVRICQINLAITLNANTFFITSLLLFMPNPYIDLFDEEGKPNKIPRTEIPADPIDDHQFETDGKEALDEILESIQAFNQQAESFSKLLSQARAIDHKDHIGLIRFFVVLEDKHNQKSLAREKKYHELLQTKFERIIVPMRDLAQLHLQTIQQFNRDIDKNYYSMEKTDRTVKSEKAMAIEGINLQRKILADGNNNLAILKDALIGTERRIKKYINAGGIDNISTSEYEMIVQKRTALTSGQNHQFNYTFFNVNLLDKTVISLGLYMKETTAQYLGKLLMAFEMN